MHGHSVCICLAFSNVCFKMFPRIACHLGYKVTLLAVILIQKNINRKNHNIMFKTRVGAYILKVIQSADSAFQFQKNLRKLRQKIATKVCKSLKINKKFSRNSIKINKKSIKINKYQ